MARHKKMDKLSRWACEALALGMRYGDYVAKYHPPGSAPAPVKEKPKVGTTHTCEYCGKEFTQYDKVWRKYCCEAHREAAYKQKVRERKTAQQIASGELIVLESVPMKECAQCGKRFVPESGHVKYCGEPCAHRAHLRQMIERQQRQALQGG